LAEYTRELGRAGTLRLLETIRTLGLGERAPLLPGFDFPKTLRPGAGDAQRESTPF